MKATDGEPDEVWYKDETNDLKNYMTKIRESISEFTNLTAEESLQVQPIIDAKKNEVDGKIAVIKEKIAELNKKFDEDKEKYVAQQDLIQKIDYMKKEYYFIFLMPIYKFGKMFS